MEQRSSRQAIARGRLQLKEMNAKLAKVTSIASGMDGSILLKAKAEAKMNDPTLQGILDAAIRSLCDDVGKIGTITRDSSLGDKCKSRSAVQ